MVVNHPSLRDEKSGDEDKYPSPESLEPTLFIEIPILQLTLSWIFISGRHCSTFLKTLDVLFNAVTLSAGKYIETLILFF